MTIFRGPGGGGNATTDSELNALTAISLEALASAVVASDAATAAAASAGQALASELAAEDAELGAEVSVVSTLGSANDAALSEFNAASSEAAALVSKTAAAASAATAATAASAIPALQVSAQSSAQELSGRSPLLVRQFTASPLISAGSSGVTQGLFVSTSGNAIWLTGDSRPSGVPSDGVVVSKYNFAGTLLNEYKYAPISHGDSIHIAQDGVGDYALLSGNATYPGIHKVQNGALLATYSFNVAIEALATMFAVDRNTGDLVSWYRPVGETVTSFWIGTLAALEAGTLYSTRINIQSMPDGPYQGIALSARNLYILTGTDSPTTDKFLYRFNVDSGDLLEKTIVNADKNYNTSLGTIQEPEGLSVVQTLNTTEISIYFGMMFGNHIQPANAKIRVYQFTRAQKNTLKISGSVHRNDNFGQITDVAVVPILLVKTAGVWVIENGIYDPSIYGVLVSNIRDGGASLKGILFDLNKPYVNLVSFSITQSANIRRLSGASAYYQRKKGSATSQLNQQIELVRDDGVALYGTDATIADTSWIMLELTVCH